MPRGMWWPPSNFRPSIAIRRWCSIQSQPPAVLDRGCNIGITDRALANNGDVIYFLENNGNHFYVHHAAGGRTSVVQRGDKFSGSLAVGNLNRAAFTSTGAAILEILPVGALWQFWRWNCSSFEKLGAAGDSSNFGTITSIDFPVETADGTLYSRIGFNDGRVRAMKYGGGSWSLVAPCCSKLGNTQLGWSYQISAAGQDGSIAVVADSNNGAGVFRLTESDPDVLAVVSSWSNVTQLAGAATGVFDAGLISATPAVYKLASGTAPAPLLLRAKTLPLR